MELPGITCYVKRQELKSSIYCLPVVAGGEVRGLAWPVPPRPSTLSFVIRGFGWVSCYRLYLLLLSIAGHG